MIKLIKLIDVNDDVVYINPDYIVAMYPCGSNEKTSIEFVNGDSDRVVNYSIKEIVQMIWEHKPGEIE